MCRGITHAMEGGVGGCVCISRQYGGDCGVWCVGYGVMVGQRVQIGGKEVAMRHGGKMR